MKIELGEFGEGQIKGFKYWYPKLEEGELMLIMKQPEINNLPFGDYSQLLYIFNLALKQRYAEHIRTVKFPRAVSKSKELNTLVGEALAAMYPDGILNTKEDVINNPPWKKEN